MHTKPRTASRWRVSASLLQYRCSTWQTCRGGCCTCHLSYRLGGEPQTLRHLSRTWRLRRPPPPPLPPPPPPPLGFFPSSRTRTPCASWSTSLSSLLFFLIVAHPGPSASGSVWFFLYCCSLCPEPWLPDSPGSPPRPPRARTFLGALLQCFFSLSSNSRPPALSQHLCGDACPHAPQQASLPCGLLHLPGVGLVDACPQKVRLYWLAMPIVPSAAGLLRCLPQRGSPQAPQVAQAARRLQICSSPCHACLSCGLRYLRLAPLPSAGPARQLVSGPMPSELSPGPAASAAAVPPAVRRAPQQHAGMHSHVHSSSAFQPLPIHGLLPPRAAILFPHTAGILSVPPSSMPSSEGRGAFPARFPISRSPAVAWSIDC